MKLRPKGQLTVPLEIREHLGLHEGDEMEFVVRGTPYSWSARNPIGRTVGGPPRGCAVVAPAE
ncbi:AbrB family looped-hinge helix DNA binding protein [Kribbella sp. VKM Ac-2571]|uniref:AbrB/MazE/SpoVT family DNA-binding domain-containing protein n=1 Tax=Kribbella sp. VKM Ac-2571 TaxID=2512222 RepID=UPI0010F36D33|nr:AbrB/MazE/SpoVT family DNA-binding domain-containing protein [Kribbella sp. VKM Ac-2571]TDO66743.1 AbrB family looped-hinge helix DNA binding protein [Kribbella sp. VKM Ac-2571]